MARKIVTILWHLITNDEMYEDEKGYKKGEVQKRKIIESEGFSVNERISIISEILAIVKKRNLILREDIESSSSHFGPWLQFNRTKM